MGSRKLRFSALALAVATGSIAGLLSSATAYAQSPTPSQWMVDHNTESQPNPYPYVTVEEGDDFCYEQNGLSRLETATVTALQDGKAAVSEMPIDQVCGYTIAQYEGFAQSLESYVETYAPNPGQKWLGIMLDEESSYGVSVANLETLNSYVKTLMRGTPGVSYVFNEVFEGAGDWTQAQFDAVISGMDDAPQVSTSYMVGYVNAAAVGTNLVTWSSHYPAPYNNQAASVNPINGAPYYACPYTSGTTCAYMSNEWNPA